MRRRRRISVQLVDTSYFSERQEIKYNIDSDTIREQRKRIRTSNDEADKAGYMYFMDIRSKNIPVNGLTSVSANPILRMNFKPNGILGKCRLAP